MVSTRHVLTVTKARQRVRTVTFQTKQRLTVTASPPPALRRPPPIAEARGDGWRTSLRAAISVAAAYAIQYKLSKGAAISRPGD
ncbi:hypothetical protein EVAR_77115_1 [Eumeta japonica]|uniref:Uncharacterized protein n=1 Tax=Eumeta variegata TaxID=151549 RepID=A0A4C1T4B8_EUMVA|nr:hypothetical protein EVAR_77115_1 [Eumeta japonica]